MNRPRFPPSPRRPPASAAVNITSSGRLHAASGARKCADADGRNIGHAVRALIVALLCVFAAPAQAQDARGRHFVDFRARPGALWGHTFIVYGRIDANGRAHEVGRAGLYPDDDHAGLIAGTLVPVNARVQAVPGDFSERPSAIYRRHLSDADYARLQAKLARMRGDERAWHLMLFNCNHFGIAIARELGLAAPPAVLVPNAWVRALAAMNGG